uniref:Uncharacterized protein n=1 Tax=Steinernema glaseri TaxID=37863 RepID=A0A1I7Z595_9BILA
MSRNIEIVVDMPPRKVIQINLCASISTALFRTALKRHSASPSYRGVPIVKFWPPAPPEPTVALADMYSRLLIGLVALCSATFVASRPLTEMEDALLPLLAETLADMDRKIEVPAEFAAIVERARRQLKRERTNRWERLGPIWG